MHPWLQSAVVIAIPMILLWIASVRLRDASIADMFWGAGFGLVAVWTYLVAGELDPRSTALTVVVAVWGTRLSLYLTWRNWGEREDRRYRAMRQAHGDRFALISLFTVFVFQGVLMWIVSFPVQWALTAEPRPLGAVELLGLAIACTGIAIETIADLQLAHFKRDAAASGAVFDRGLWRYSRHPNYFGDFVVWWGVFLLGFSGTGYLVTAIGPIVMSVMLMKVSGVALLEKDIGERRPAYADYIRRTSPFFPMPPSSGST